MLEKRRRRLGARTTYVVVAVTTALVVALRVPFLRNGTYPDEGGMLVVARQWHAGGPFLYGDVFLARPPLLLAFFRAADGLGGIFSVRLLGLGLAAVAVMAAAWAGSSLSGRRGAVTAAVVTAALLTDPRLGTREINAETVGLPLVLLAAAFLLAGVRRTTGRAALLAAGGAYAAAALLTKQNLADPLVFGLVLVVVPAVRAEGRPQAMRDLGWLLAGAAAPLAATLAWLVWSGHNASDFVYTLYGFRLEGGQTMLAHPTDSQGGRLNDLVRASVTSGMVPVVLASLWLLRRRLREPVVLALLAMLLTALVGIAGGGGYWIHYDLGLVPVTALLAARASSEVRAPRLLAVLVAATVVASLISTGNAFRGRTPAEQTWVGGTSTWMGSVQRPGDSVVVLYGEAALYDASRLRPAYPYIWTLPMRVRDPG